jgi:hypothetical protein
MSGDDHDLRTLQHIDATFRDQIRQADQKASILIAFIAGLFTLNRDAIGLTRDMMSGRTSLHAILNVVLFLLLFASMASAFSAIIPRIDRRATSILFWQNWRSEKDIVEIRQRISDVDFVRAELIRDIGVLAGIVHRKMYWLRWALIALYGGLLIFGVLASFKALS